MGCEEIRDLLALYAGGESYENERSAVEAHVSVCAACARDLDQYREVRASLASRREGAAPPGTFKSIWTGVRADCFPLKETPKQPWMDAVLRYAAVVMVGIAIGVLVHVSQRRAPALPAAPTETAAAAPATIPAPVQPATMPLRVVPNRRAPSLELDGSFYLPRVESIPAGKAKDY